jgi:hypothetical protein
MADHIGIGVSGQTSGMVNPQTTQYESPALHQSMRIVPDSYPQGESPLPGRVRPNRGSELPERPTLNRRPENRSVFRHA